MHSVTSCTATIDAGRQALPAVSHTTLDPSVQSANDTPVSQSPVQTAVRERPEARPKMANARRSTLKRVTWLVNLIIPIFGKSRAATDTRAPNGGLQDLTELKDAHQAACLAALQDENDKARIALKASIMPYCTSEQFDKVFPPSLQYISKALAEEISDRLWEELVSASERK